MKNKDVMELRRLAKTANSKELGNRLSALADEALCKDIKEEFLAKGWKTSATDENCFKNETGLAFGVRDELFYVYFEHKMVASIPLHRVVLFDVYENSVYVNDMVFF